MAKMTRLDAEHLLEIADAQNPGPWVDHSRHVAKAAEKIAAATRTLDSNRAYIGGLLHDIGRYRGKYQNRHLVDGYNLLCKEGDEETARICITHAFVHPVPESLFGKWDCSEEEYRFVSDYVRSITFDDYDFLIQLCDFLATADGFVILEKRMVDVQLRYGPNPFVVEKWNAAFALKHRFDAMVEGNVYLLLDGIVETTFAA